jgi:hypothetical protein
MGVARHAMAFLLQLTVDVGHAAIRLIMHLIKDGRAFDGFLFSLRYDVHQVAGMRVAGRGAE